MAKKNSAPAKVYGIDDFIAEMKHPMPYINTLSRIHLLTGFNKSALILLRNHLAVIMGYGKVMVYRKFWITEDGIKLIGEPVNDAKDPKKNGRVKRITPLHMHQLFLIVAIDCLIDGRAIPEPFVNHTLLPEWHYDPDPKATISIRAEALIRFYLNKRVKYTEGKLYQAYNLVSKSNYRLGGKKTVGLKDGIAESDRQNYVDDHESCGLELKRLGDIKAIEHWQDDRNHLQKTPRFMDCYR